VTDPVLDEESGPKTGKRVSVDQPEEPRFLVKGITPLRVGPVISIHASEQSLSSGDNIRLELAGQSYQLKVASRGEPEKGIISDDAKLLLTVGTVTQTLYALNSKGANEPGWSLLWAGDLDGDGKLDLYLGLSNHYNVSQHKLFLSSQARKGQLVREVAEFVITGC
jgi:hypothetical protein